MITISLQVHGPIALAGTFLVLFVILFTLANRDSWHGAPNLWDAQKPSPRNWTTLLGKLAQVFSASTTMLKELRLLWLAMLLGGLTLLRVFGDRDIEEVIVAGLRCLSR